MLFAEGADPRKGSGAYVGGRFNFEGPQKTPMLFNKKIDFCAVVRSPEKDSGFTLAIMDLTVSLEDHPLFKKSAPQGRLQRSGQTFVDGVGDARIKEIKFRVSGEPLPKALSPRL